VSCCKDSLSYLEYFTVRDHSKETIMLKESCRRAYTFLDTQKKYEYIVSILPQKPVSDREANVFSTTHVVHFQDEKYHVEDIRGFVT
jgi:hypothetical protein